MSHVPHPAMRETRLWSHKTQEAYLEARAGVGWHLKREADGPQLQKHCPAQPWHLQLKNRRAVGRKRAAIACPIPLPSPEFMLLTLKRAES